METFGFMLIERDVHETVNLSHMLALYSVLQSGHPIFLFTTHFCLLDFGKACQVYLYTGATQ